LQVADCKLEVASCKLNRPGICTLRGQTSGSPTMECSTLQVGNWLRRLLVARDLDERSVFDRDAEQIDMAGALALCFVHQLVGTLNQIGGETLRDEAPVDDAPQPEADDADVDANGLSREPTILERPVETLDRFAEPFGDRVRLRVLGEIGDEKAE